VLVVELWWWVGEGLGFLGGWGRELLRGFGRGGGGVVDRVCLKG